MIELFEDEIPPEHAGVIRRLGEIQKKAIENFEERGLETMFLAVGLATNLSYKRKYGRGSWIAVG